MDCKNNFALAAELIRFQDEEIDFPALVGAMLNLKLWVKNEPQLKARGSTSLLDHWRYQGTEFLNRVAVKSPDFPLVINKPQPPPCPVCGGPTRRKSGRKGEFWGCTGYPDCKGSCDVDHTQEILENFRKL